jgi:hypothetical protein
MWIVAPVVKANVLWLHGDSKSKRHASMEAQLLLQHRELVTDTCASRLQGHVCGLKRSAPEQPDQRAVPVTADSPNLRPIHQHLTRI